MTINKQKARYLCKMQKLLYTLGLFTFVLFIANSCQKPLPNGGKPFYIVVDSAKVQIDNPSVQGTSSSKLEQIWVEVGGNNLGVYALPIKFPVLSDPGTYKILIQPAIKNKGISAQRQIYPLLESVYEDITFDVNKSTYVIHPVYRYLSRCNFEMNETFEFSNNFDANLDVVNDSNSFEGTNSGMITLPPSSGKTTTTNWLNIPVGSVAYIELNYKTQAPFSVGLLSEESGNTTDLQLVVIDTKSYWNKMYIDITPEISNINTGSYKFYFKSYNDDSTSTKKVFVDNFKVIYL